MMTMIRLADCIVRSRAASAALFGVLVAGLAFLLLGAEAVKRGRPEPPKLPWLEAVNRREAPAPLPNEGLLSVLPGVYRYSGQMPSGPILPFEPALFRQEEPQREMRPRPLSAAAPLLALGYSK